jgi:hypothetical protein
MRVTVCRREGMRVTVCVCTCCTHTHTHTMQNKLSYSVSKIYRILLFLEGYRWSTCNLNYVWTVLNDSVIKASYTSSLGPYILLA